MAAVQKNHLKATLTASLLSAQNRISPLHHDMSCACDEKMFIS